MIDGVNGWLNGESDKFFDYMFNSSNDSQYSHNSVKDEGKIEESVDNISNAENEKMCSRDGPRTQYVRLVRRWVDSAIVVGVDGSKSVNLGKSNLRGILWTAESMRIIADYLDELNIGWEVDLCSYFDDYSFGTVLQLDD